MGDELSSRRPVLHTSKPSPLLNILWLRTTWSAENAAFGMTDHPQPHWQPSGEPVSFTPSLLKVSQLTQEQKERSRQSKATVIFSFWTGQRPQSGFFTCLFVSLAGQPEDWLLATTSVALSLTHHPWNGCTRVSCHSAIHSFIHSFIHPGCWCFYCSANDLFCFHTTWQDSATSVFQKKPTPFPRKEQSSFNIFIENWSWNTSTFGIRV